MTLLKKVTYLLLLSFVTASLVQCASSKFKLEKQAAFQSERIYYQEWFAGVQVGGTGINLFFPNLNPKANVRIDSVYFRGLKAKLEQSKGMYAAILKNKSPYDTSKQVKKIPFKLTNNECVVSYYENGEQKFYKLKNIREKEGIYYEAGPPKSLVISD